MTVVLGILEFFLYTIIMPNLEVLRTNNPVYDLILHFIFCFIFGILLYYLLRFILVKKGRRAKKYLYQVIGYNMIFGLIFPILLIAIIPNKGFLNFALMAIVSTFYYGLFINLVILMANYFLSNRKKEQ